MHSDFLITEKTLRALSPPVFKPRSRKQIKEHLERDGYIVVQVMNAKEADKTLAEFEEWIENIDDRIDLSNPTEELFPDNILGIIKSYGIGQASFMQKVRNNPNINKLFANVLNCKELICSFDGAGYIPWQFSKPKDFNLWPHRDQHPSKKGFMTYQGSLNLSKNDKKGDGGFVVWPKTHTLENWRSALPELCAETKGDFFEIPRAINGITINSARRLIIPPGAFILWDSRTIHCNSMPIKSKNTRAIVYVCMVDRKLANDFIMRKRAKCVKMKKTTSHHPVDFSINKDEIVYTNSKIIPIS